MSTILIGLIGVMAMIFLIMIGLPIGFSLGVVGFVGTISLIGLSAALPQLHLTFYNLVSSYSFTLLPFFILMGAFAGVSGISSDLYSVAEKWVRKLPGGLAIATITACAGFSSISGSSIATAATMSVVSLPEMKKNKYDIGLATGTIAAGGTLGFLIPPSVAFVIYGMITTQSVGELLIAGFLPGMLLAGTFCLIIIIRVMLKPELAPANTVAVGWKEKIVSLKDIWGVLLVFFLVMGGIFLGFFTPTEAGAVGAFTLLIFGLIRKRLTIDTFYRTLKESARTMCMIFIVIYGAFLFNDFLTLARVPMVMAEAVTSLPLSRYAIFSLIILLFVILGMFIEPIPMMIMTVPSVLPAIEFLGFSPIWFGVISVLMVEAALITPPVGINVFIISGVVENVPVMTIFKGVMPFLISIIIVVALLTVFPQIALFLPNIMMR